MALPTFALPGGVTKMPGIGFGVGTVWFNRGANESDKPLNLDLISSIKSALKLGYRHLDAAEVYGTEREVGIAIKESGIPREQLFVTTKVLSEIRDPLRAIKDSLSRLQLDYVDLYLIHSPFVTPTSHGTTRSQAWSVLEEIQDLGLAKSIGVSNYQIAHLEELLAAARIKPSVNQIEFHPYLQQKDLLAFSKEKGIFLQAYSPLISLTKKRGGPLDAVVDDIATRLGKSNSQILLRWVVEKGIVVLTTSGKVQRQLEQLQVGSFQLSKEDVARIDLAGSQLSHRQYWQKEFQEFESSKL